MTKDIEKRRAASRRYKAKLRAEQPERVKADQKRWRDANRKKVRERARAYMDSRPRERMLWGAKYRAAQKGIPFDLVPEDISIPTICPVLGTPMEKPTLDRIEGHLGYVRGNVAVISHRANRIKSDATLDELERITKWMRTHLEKTT